MEKLNHTYDSFSHASAGEGIELFDKYVIAYAVDDLGNVTKWKSTHGKPLPTEQLEWANVVKPFADCDDEEIKRLYQYYLSCDDAEMDDYIADYICARLGYFRLRGYSGYGYGRIYWDCLCGTVEDDWSYMQDIADELGEPITAEEVEDSLTTECVDARSAKRFAAAVADTLRDDD